MSSQTKKNKSEIITESKQKAVQFKSSLLQRLLKKADPSDVPDYIKKSIYVPTETKNQLEIESESEDSSSDEEISITVKKNQEQLEVESDSEISINKSEPKNFEQLEVESESEEIPITDETNKNDSDSEEDDKITKISKRKSPLKEKAFEEEEEEIEIEIPLPKKSKSVEKKPIESAKKRKESSTKVKSSPLKKSKEDKLEIVIKESENVIPFENPTKKLSSGKDSETEEEMLSFIASKIHQSQPNYESTYLNGKTVEELDIFVTGFLFRATNNSLMKQKMLMELNTLIQKHSTKKSANGINNDKLKQMSDNFSEIQYKETLELMLTKLSKLIKKNAEFHQILSNIQKKVSDPKKKEKEESIVESSIDLENINENINQNINEKAKVTESSSNNSDSEADDKPILPSKKIQLEIEEDETPILNIQNTISSKKEKVTQKPLIVEKKVILPPPKPSSLLKNIYAKKTSNELVNPYGKKVNSKIINREQNQHVESNSELQYGSNELIFRNLVKRASELKDKKVSLTTLDERIKFLSDPVNNSKSNLTRNKSLISIEEAKNVLKHKKEIILLLQEMFTSELTFLTNEERKKIAEAGPVPNSIPAQLIFAYEKNVIQKLRNETNEIRLTFDYVPVITTGGSKFLLNPYNPNPNLEDVHEHNYLTIAKKIKLETIKRTFNELKQQVLQKINKEDISDAEVIATSVILDGIAENPPFIYDIFTSHQFLTKCVLKHRQICELRIPANNIELLYKSNFHFNDTNEQKLYCRAIPPIPENYNLVANDFEYFMYLRAIHYHDSRSNYENWCNLKDSLNPQVSSLEKLTYTRFIQKTTPIAGFAYKDFNSGIPKYEFPKNGKPAEDLFYYDHDLSLSFKAFYSWVILCYEIMLTKHDWALMIDDPFESEIGQTIFKELIKKKKNDIQGKSFQTILYEFYKLTILLDTSEHPSRVSIDSLTFINNFIRHWIPYIIFFPCGTLFDPSKLYYDNKSEFYKHFDVISKQTNLFSTEFDRIQRIVEIPLRNTNIKEIIASTKVYESISKDWANVHLEETAKQQQTVFNLWLIDIIHQRNLFPIDWNDS